MPSHHRRRCSRSLLLRAVHVTAVAQPPAQALQPLGLFLGAAAPGGLPLRRLFRALLGAGLGAEQGEGRLRPAFRVVLVLVVLLRAMECAA